MIFSFSTNNPSPFSPGEYFCLSLVEPQLDTLVWADEQAVG
jgi:hypothetical protein